MEWWLIMYSLKPPARPELEAPDVTIRATPATATRWNDVVTAFGPREVDPAWCWCRRFLDGHRVAEAATGNRDALLREVSTASIPSGLIAYVDGTPAGWTRVMPRHDLPGVMANRALRRLLTDDAGAWWVTCFAIQRQYRNIGVARTLLDAAVVHARQHRATAVEGHPVDTDALQAERVSGSALFTG